MRITVIDVDHDDAAAALAAINAALGRSNGTPVETKRRKKERPAIEAKKPPVIEAELVETVEIPKKQADAWNWLVANDIQKGRSVAEIAKGLGIKREAAIWRMNKLIAKGLAHRVRRGFYRSGEAK